MTVDCSCPVLQFSLYKNFAGSGYTSQLNFNDLAVYANSGNYILRSTEQYISSNQYGNIGLNICRISDISFDVNGVVCTIDDSKQASFTCKLIVKNSGSYIAYDSNNVSHTVSASNYPLEFVALGSLPRYSDGGIVDIRIDLPTAEALRNMIVNKQMEENPELGNYDHWTYTPNFSAYAEVYCDSWSCDGQSSNCDDLRSSGSTESCEVGLVGQFAGESYSQSFNLLFQPDTNHTSGELNNLGSISLETLDSGYCRFDNTISSVRGVGVISLWGHLTGVYTSVPGTDFPSLIPYTGQSRVICSWSFDDPCCSSATGFSDNIDSFNDEYLEEDLRGNCEIVIDKIVWSGFERLTDYCCDDSDCVNRPNDDIGFDGNHDDHDYDDDCICEELVVLEGKFDALISTLGVIKDSLDAINYTLQHKDFSVTVNPHITVEPCEPEITVQSATPTINVNPSPVPVTVQSATPTINVNPSPVPVTVQSATPTINVNPSSVPVTVQSAAPTINVEPCQPLINVTSSCPDVYVNNSDLITCLNGLFKVDSDSLAKIMNDTLKVTYQDSISGDVVTDGLTKVIKDKDFDNEVICEVSKIDWAYEGYGNIRIPDDN